MSHEHSNQFATATEQATDRVRVEGTDNASDRDLFLMGFGALIEELHGLRESFDRTNGTGNGRVNRIKRQAPTAAGAGGAVAIVMAALQRFL